MKRKVVVCLLTVALVFIYLSLALGEDNAVHPVIISSSVLLEMSSDVPEAPTIISTPATAVFVENRYIYDVDAVVDARSPVPTYMLITYPMGMTIDPISGLIEWVPESLGDFDVSVKAFNFAGADVQSFTLTVSEHPQPSQLRKCLVVDMDNQDQNQAAKTNQERPTTFALFQNHPNLFNPETEISYVLSKDTYVNLSIYNILGQKVKTLVDGFETAGHKSVRWDGKDQGGNQVTSGVYFYKICARSFVQTNKMVMLK